MKATGDLSANIVKLRDALRRAKYDGPVDVPALGLGEPAGYLPLLHYALLHSSRPVAAWLATSGYELSAKTDMRFVEVVYRLVREEFGYRHKLTCKQMLGAGFAEHKILFVVDVLELCRGKHAQLGRERTLRTNSANGTASPHQSADGAGTLITPRATMTLPLSALGAAAPEEPRSAPPPRPLAVGPLPRSPRRPATVPMAPLATAAAAAVAARPNVRVELATTTVTGGAANAWVRARQPHQAPQAPPPPPLAVFVDGGGGAAAQQVLDDLEPEVPSAVVHVPISVPVQRPVARDATVVSAAPLGSCLRCSLVAPREPQVAPRVPQVRSCAPLMMTTISGALLETGQADESEDAAELQAPNAAPIAEAGGLSARQALHLLLDRASEAASDEYTEDYTIDDVDEIDEVDEVDEVEEVEEVDEAETEAYDAIESFEAADVAGSSFFLTQLVEPLADDAPSIPARRPAFSRPAWHALDAMPPPPLLPPPLLSPPAENLSQVTRAASDVEVMAAAGEVVVVTPPPMPTPPSAIATATEMAPSEAVLSGEDARLVQLVQMVFAKVATLSQQTEQVVARLALLEGRMKLIEAVAEKAVATPLASVAPAPSAAGMTAMPAMPTMTAMTAMTMEMESIIAATSPPKVMQSSLPVASSPPTATPAAVTPEARVFTTPNPRTCEDPRTSLDGTATDAAKRREMLLGPSPRTLSVADQRIIATTCQGAFSTFISTRAFIDDVERRFSDTHEALARRFNETQAAISAAGAE